MSSPLRILHVVDTLERGGLERVVTDLAVSQQSAGDSVKVFCLYRRGPLAAELEAANIRVLCAGKKDGRDPRPLLRLWQAAAFGSWDIVHAHNLVPNYYAAFALLGALRRPALVNSCHDMGTRLSNERLRRLYRWSLSRTDRVAMVANQVYDFYVGGGYLPASRATTIINGVPVAKYSDAPRRRPAARAMLGIPADAFVIGCVGRLVPLKNHALLIRTLPALLDAHRALKVVLIGGGALESELRREAQRAGVQDHVIFAGERSDVHDLLPAFDLFALPSSSEGLSIALLEAAITGLPIVATAVGGNSQVICHGKTGFLIPPDDPDALQQTLLRLLPDEALRRQVGAAAREWAIANASVDAQRTAFDKLYRAALR